MSSYSLSLGINTCTTTEEELALAALALQAGLAAGKEPKPVASRMRMVVPGEGWGSGSSPEHAVWARQGAGIQAIVAKSHAFIYKRNLVIGALPCLVVPDPAFYEAAGEGSELEIDLASGRIRDVASGREFQAQVAPPMILALQAEGRLVSAIKRHGKEVFARLSV